jgi:hypothetical protein
LFSSIENKKLVVNAFLKEVFEEQGWEYHESHNEESEQFELLKLKVFLEKSKSLLSKDFSKITRHNSINNKEENNENISQTKNN